MIKNVIFDLDGTLLDTSEGILDSVRYTIAALSYSELPYDELLTFVGPPIQQSFMEHFGCNAETAQRAADIFRNYYKDTALLRAVPYEGVYDLCDELKRRGMKLAVATYKREDYALTLLKHFQFNTYCSPMHGADGNNKLKKKDIVQMCMLEMDAKPDNTVLVGDTEHDAAGAIEAGVAFLAVTYGFGFRDGVDLKGLNYIGIADKPKTVADILFQHKW